MDKYEMTVKVREVFINQIYGTNQYIELIFTYSLV